MFTSFKELEAYVLGCGMKKRIALANAHDEPALSAVVNARRKGVVEGTLVGKKNEIIAMLHEMGESEKDYEIVDFDGEELDAAKLTVQLVREGKADIPMKGILQTSNFARAILNRETGLIPASGKRLVSQCGIFEYEGRFVMITDAAINIAPDVETQIGIVENALPVAKALGNDCPKVAVLSAVENVTEKMPSTVSAAAIKERGIPGCVVTGPLALDGAISMESVKHKAIKDPVAGQADILLVPFIEIGNVLYKAVTYIAGKTVASTICGASCPVIITSRADTEAVAAELSQRYGCAILLKGGHRVTDADDLLWQDGQGTWLSGSKVDNPNAHGTGCTLSSAIAANLANGLDLFQAVRAAKAYLTAALRAGLDLGRGPGPLDHTLGGRTKRTQAFFDFLEEQS